MVIGACFTIGAVVFFKVKCFYSFLELGHLVKRHAAIVLGQGNVEHVPVVVGATLVWLALCIGTALFVPEVCIVGKVHKFCP